MSFHPYTAIYIAFGLQERAHVVAENAWKTKITAETTGVMQLQQSPQIDADDWAIQMHHGWSLLDNH